MSIALSPAARSQRGASLLKVVIVLFVALFAIFGAKLIYQKVTYKQPYRQAGDQFMSALAKDDAGASYALFSDNLKRQFTSDEWKKQLDSSFSGYNGSPKYISTTAMSDTKNLYGTNANPQQLKYTLTLKGKNYAMYLTVFYEKNAWKVDEFNSVVAR